MAIGRRVSLSRVPSSAEWNALYALSVKQAVVGEAHGMECKM